MGELLEVVVVLAVYGWIGFGLLATAEWLSTRRWGWVERVNGALDRALGGRP